LWGTRSIPRALSERFPKSATPVFGQEARQQRNSKTKTLPASEGKMDSIIYLVGLVVVVMAILSFLGLH
jgi:hypothetical protein